MATDVFPLWRTSALQEDRFSPLPKLQAQERRKLRLPAERVEIVEELEGGRSHEVFPDGRLRAASRLTVNTRWLRARTHELEGHGFGSRADGTRHSPGGSAGRRVRGVVARCEAGFPRQRPEHGQG